MALFGDLCNFRHLRLFPAHNRFMHLNAKTISHISPSVDGGWTGFGAWSHCSAECGGGNQTRSRSCSNPAPAFGGADCVGSTQESQECNTQPCPGMIEISHSKTIYLP